MTTDPFAGPFLTSLQLTDYSDDPDFAILPGTGKREDKETER